MPYKRTGKYTPRRVSGGGKYGGFKRRKTVISRRSVNKLLKTTRLAFKQSFISRHPMPDRFFTWFTINNTGNFAAGAVAAGSFSILLSTLLLPFNVNAVNAAFSNLPNPFGALGAISYGGYKNLVWNAATNSGVYTNHRVWTVKVEIECVPNAQGQSYGVVMAPIAGPVASVASYSNYTTQAQAPNAVVKTATIYDTNGNTLRGEYSIPSLLGIPKDQYSTLAGLSGFGTGAPPLGAVLQVSWATSDGTNLSSNLTFRIKLTAHAELFGRTDTQQSL